MPRDRSRSARLPRVSRRRDGAVDARAAHGKMRQVRFR